jgi:hypothetical protein
VYTIQFRPNKDLTPGSGSIKMVSLKCKWRVQDSRRRAASIIVCELHTVHEVAFLDPSDSYFLFVDLVGLYTHWTYMHIFLSNYWWQRSDIWSQASYKSGLTKTSCKYYCVWITYCTWQGLILFYTMGMNVS